MTNEQLNTLINLVNDKLMEPNISAWSYNKLLKIRDELRQMVNTTKV